MNQIKPYEVWVGHAGDGRAARELLDLGIRAVVQLAMEEPPIQAPRELISLRFPLLDGEGNDRPMLQLAIDAAARLIEARAPTLVCCGAGMSRAPAIVAAALSVVEGFGLEEALGLVTSSRPADVSPALFSEIKEALRSGRERFGR